MSEPDKLEHILELSVKKNGEKPLTNKWLLNCIRKARRMEEEEERRLDAIEAHSELF